MQLHGWWTIALQCNLENLGKMISAVLNRIAAIKTLSSQDKINGFNYQSLAENVIFNSQINRF